MRFTDKIKRLGGVYLDIIHIQNRLLYYCNYYEDYLFNQDGELLIIGHTIYKFKNNPIMIEMVE